MSIKHLLSFLCLSLPLAANAEQARNLLDDNLSHFQNIYNYGSAEVVDEVLELSATDNWFLITKESFGDFILTAEVLMPDVSEYSNSGIIFRGQTLNRGGTLEAMGYQAEVDPSDRKWSGGLYDQARREWLHPLHETRSHPDEDFLHNHLPEWTDEMANAYQHLQWNRYRIECRGSDIKIYLNNVLTTHVADSKDAEGFIGLQHHGSELLKNTGKSNNIVRFRNVYITELD